MFLINYFLDYYFLSFQSSLFYLSTYSSSDFYYTFYYTFYYLVYLGYFKLSKFYNGLPFFRNFAFIFEDIYL